MQEPTAVRAVRQASGTIPIVMAGGSEIPVERGLIASLARPGGTVTGMTAGTPDLPAKRLQLLRDVVPHLSRVAFIGAEAEPIEVNPKVVGLTAAAQALGLQLHLASLRTPNDFAPNDFEAVFTAMTRNQVGAFVMDSSPLAINNRPRLSELAIRHRLPSIWGSSAFKDAALLTYGPNILDLWRRAATHIDKILQGSRPADLPVELPTAFDFTVNSQIARALGLTIPASVLQQATEIIQ